MKIFPALDLMNGDSVRLVEGKRESKKVYGDPVKFAKQFSRFVDKVHIVDLDGAFSGKPKNLYTVERIIAETDLSVQLGGGIRTREDVKTVKKIGVENPIIGTKALDRRFLEEVSDQFTGITVSLDMAPTGLAVQGWEKNLDLGYREVFTELTRFVDRFVFTSVAFDGKLEGVSSMDKFWDKEKVIYAGGVTSKEDLTNLDRTGFSGAIIGKALYEGYLDLREIAKSFGDRNAR